MELKVSGVAVLLIALAVCSRESESREITHEDIKDAMLSLVHMMRDNTEKLERHEARDRQTAEQLKKALSLLTKRMSSIDGFKAYLVKLDERMTGLEQMINQKDERERVQIQKTADTIEDLESRLEGWATEIESKVVEGIGRALPASPGPTDPSTDVASKIQIVGDMIGGEFVQLQETLEIKIDAVRDNVLSEVRDIGKKIKDASDLLNKLDSVGSTASTPESSAALEEQSRAIEHVQGLLRSTLDEIQSLPSTAELQTLHNETQMTLQETRHALRDAIAQGNGAIETRMAESREEAKDAMASLRSQLASNEEWLKKEMHDLGQGQSVMVEMADHVLDTKKRLEHAYKILREVGELVMAQGSNINSTLNTRFDGISNDIMDNQNGALANLTVKMEQEMNQVWRQINVMYQQMMASATALDKLHKQNEAYVNGTTSTMDGMESKVGEITKRMGEVDTNLNYLLGRLSLVTQEFNQIKEGLGAALDNIKASFKAVQEKANDLSGNPGPHPVPKGYTEFDGNAEPSDNNSDAVVNLPAN